MNGNRNATYKRKHVRSHPVRKLSLGANSVTVFSASSALCLAAPWRRSWAWVHYIDVSRHTSRSESARDPLLVLLQELTEQRFIEETSEVPNCLIFRCPLLHPPCLLEKYVNNPRQGCRRKGAADSRSHSCRHTGCSTWPANDGNDRYEGRLSIQKTSNLATIRDTPCFR